jgi:hypothetical protein
MLPKIRHFYEPLFGPLKGLVNSLLSPSFTVLSNYRKIWSSPITIFSQYTLCSREELEILDLLDTKMLKCLAKATFRTRYTLTGQRNGKMSHSFDEISGKASVRGF